MSVGLFYSRNYHRVGLWVRSSFPQCIQCGFVWIDGEFPAGCDDRWDGCEGGPETRFNIGTDEWTKKWWQRQAQQRASNPCQGKAVLGSNPASSGQNLHFGGAEIFFFPNLGCPAQSDLKFLSEFSGCEGGKKTPQSSLWLEVVADLGFGGFWAGQIPPREGIVSLRNSWFSVPLLFLTQDLGFYLSAVKTRIFIS